MGEVSVILRSFLALFCNLSDSGYSGFFFFKVLHMHEKACCTGLIAVFKCVLIQWILESVLDSTGETLSDLRFRGHWTCPDQMAVLNLKKKQSTSRGNHVSLSTSRI